MHKFVEIGTIFQENPLGAVAMSNRGLITVSPKLGDVNRLSPIKGAEVTTSPMITGTSPTQNEAMNVISQNNRSSLTV